MSEYQYYEFVAIDRPLAPGEVAALRKFSTRADITATRFVNEYHWGSFKGDVDRFLRDYFDAHVYVANWGTRRFAFRLPRDLVDRAAVAAYAHPGSVDVRPADEWLLVDINTDPEDGGDEVDGDGWMASLAGLRAEVLGGDMRPLFLGWLAGLQAAGPAGGDREDAADGDDDDGDDAAAAAPPVPPGMGSLSAPQRAMVEFFDIDADLLDAIAAAGPPAAPAADWTSALRSAPAAKKDRWLLDLLAGTDPLAAVRIRRELATERPPPPASAARTVRQLREAWGELSTRRRLAAAAAAERSKQKRDAAAASARERHLSDLAGRVEATWREVDAAIGMKTRDGYARAVGLIAGRPGGDPAAFDAHLSGRLDEHRRRPTFMAAARQAGLAVG